VLWDDQKRCVHQRAVLAKFKIQTQSAPHVASQTVLSGLLKGIRSNNKGSTDANLSLTDENIHNKRKRINRANRNTPIIIPRTQAS
jgi:hypothetical protein